MTTDQTDIMDQAIAWHVRQDDMNERDWTAFVAWLESDPEHAAAFDRVTLRDAQLPGLFARETSRNKHRHDPPRMRRWLWAGGSGAVAAALGLAIMPSVLPRQSSTYSVATAAGERHQLVLADGTRVDMNGGTRLEFDRNDPRNVKIAMGEATFSVKHSPVPFRVHAGDMVIEDLGTVFNVVRDVRRLDVQVAEGAVRFDPKGAAIDLTRGRALSARLDTREVVLDNVDAANVGGWRNGRLQFQGEPVSMVIDAIGRYSDTKLVADPELSARPFTGMVVLSGNVSQDVQNVAALMGADWRRDGERWVLSPKSERTP